MATEQKIEEDLIARLEAQKYTYRPDIRDNAALEQNFRAKFAALNRVNLTDSEFARLINGVPVVQIELKALGLTPRRAMQQIVEYKNDPGNGYIWHTTGSGKTLTSFKAATLLKDNPEIDKCLFVVDRKDLDRQTREEFNKFQEGCVEQNTNTEALVQRLLSDNYADKVIVATIQKLGLALDENSQRSRRHKERGRQTYKERLAPLREQRIVFIFDECHRSQFGDNHQAIKEFFPNAQLFGFTGTPIFEDNATYKQIDGTMGSYKTTEAIFQKQLHAYTITHAIEDENVLRFHIDYFGETPRGDKEKSRQQPASPESVVAEIIKKHDSATNQRRFNALLATASINDAIKYYRLFKQAQAKQQAKDENYAPLNIACVFSPPAEGNKDVQQIQEDLPQEKEDNRQAPDRKKAALQEIIADYNTRYGANHSINEFDLYYQDVQQRIKDQQYPNRDYPRENKIDITIVVDMLLTGFDSKYLNTLYVDKTLKYHSLIQAFSRTNRVLNDTKPYGNILDFRAQRDAVDTAITRFSGQDPDRAKEIWLVDPAPKVIKKLRDAVANLKTFMTSQDLDCTPENVNNLQGDEARSGFINQFKEVQRLKARQAKGDDPDDPVQQLEFELVLFGSALIDYDYIMRLIAASTHDQPGRQKMSRQQLIDLISSSANLMEDLIRLLKRRAEGRDISGLKAYE